MPHSKFLSQVFQVGFWCRKKGIWSTHLVDWEVDLKSIYLLNTCVVTCRAVGLCGFRNSLLVYWKPFLKALWQFHPLPIQSISATTSGGDCLKISSFLENFWVTLANDDGQTFKAHKSIGILNITTTIEATVINMKMNASTSTILKVVLKQFA